MRSIDLTYEQGELLVRVVAHAAQREQARINRMKARPPGSHGPVTIRLAERDAERLAELLRVVSP